MVEFINIKKRGQGKGEAPAGAGVPKVINN